MCGLFDALSLTVPLISLHACSPSRCGVLRWTDRGTCHADMVIAVSGAGEAPDAIHLGYRLSGMVYIEEIVEQVNPFADESSNDAVKTFFIKDSKHDFASLDELRCAALLSFQHHFTALFNAL